MQISNDKFVGITYTLTVDGKVADQATAERPLEFLFGMGMLLPKFEEYLEGKIEGDSFKFTLSPEEGYGKRIETNVVDLPKSIFMVDGKVVEAALTVGNMLPMSDANGNRLMGMVAAIGEDTIRMDFNHPMADKTLNFEGTVVTVRDSTEEDNKRFFGPSEGCGCGCHQGEGCNCNCSGDCANGGCCD